LRDSGHRPLVTMFTTPRLLQRQQQAYMLRIMISACLPHLHSTSPLGGSCRNIAIPFGMKN